MKFTADSPCLQVWSHLTLKSCLLEKYTATGDCRIPAMPPKAYCKSSRDMHEQTSVLSVMPGPNGNCLGLRWLLVYLYIEIGDVRITCDTVTGVKSN